jgi:hypothetical protein
MRLAHKQTVLSAQGTPRVKRVFDRARPPFDRLCKSNAISGTNRSYLQALRDQTNPLQLRQEIYDLLDVLFTLPGATPGVTENIFETLSTHSQKDLL